MSERAKRRTTIVPVDPTHAEVVEAITPELDPEAKVFASRSRADNTRRAYQSQWSRFVGWCEHKGLNPRPAHRTTVANYLTYLASFGVDPELDRALKREGPLKAPSIKQAKAVIGKAHKDVGLPSPTETREVLDVWEGIQRTLGSEVDKKAPILPAQLAAMLALTPDTLLGARDRAMLLLGWAGAFRRSELVALDVEDLFRGDEPGTIIAFLRKSKTDQRGTGKRKPILPSEDENLCPVRAVTSWLKVSGITTGPIFRPSSPDGRSLLERRLSDDMVYETVLLYVGGAGLDPGVFKSFGAHSLRAGFCTTAVEAGKDLDQIMQVTGHAKVDTLMGYVRNSKLFSSRSAGRGLLDGVVNKTDPR